MTKNNFAQAQKFYEIYYDALTFKGLYTPWEWLPARERAAWMILAMKAYELFEDEVSV